MKKPGFFLLLLVAAIVVSPGTWWTEKDWLPGANVVFAQEAWKPEFEYICSKTQDAMTFSSDELKTLIARCDKLKPLIEKLDETEKKIFLKKLQKCKDLFLFVLESKERQ